MKTNKNELPPVFVMQDAFGNCHIMISHNTELFPHFRFCSFFYGYGYTDNASIRDNAANMAINLGATEPVHFEKEDIGDTLDKMIKESKIENSKAQLIIDVLSCVDHGFREPKEQKSQEFHDGLERIHQVYRAKSEDMNRNDAMNAAKLDFLTNMIIN